MNVLEMTRTVHRRVFSIVSTCLVSVGAVFVWLSANWSVYTEASNLAEGTPYYNAAYIFIFSYFVAATSATAIAITTVLLCVWSLLQRCSSVKCQRKLPLLLLELLCAAAFGAGWTTLKLDHAVFLRSGIHLGSPMRVQCSICVSMLFCA